MNQLRERWEGVSLPGGYLLQRWLHGDDASGFFETSPAPDGSRAVVKLMVESAAQLALWQRTRLLRHPNLCQMLDCGRAELGGERVVYAVFEYADDRLAAALARSPLSETEAREVLDATVAALRYLQAEGLAHPALDPDHVVAVGETVKLTVDALRDAATDTQFTEELRAFWYQISPSTMARSADVLAQSLGANPPSLAPPAPAPVETAPEPALPDGEAAKAGSKPFPKWILVGVAALLLLILGLNLRRSPEAPAPPPPPPLAEAPAAKAPAPIPAPAVEKASPAAKPVAKPAAKPAAKAAAKPAPAGQRMWRVIAFTSRTRDDAARRAGQINKSHSDFKATVFTPPEKKGYFLVALGGRMSREDAVRVQKKARAVGVSRDVYFKKFLD